MTLDLQFKIRENPNYIRYLREHSYWYKILNRNPNEFKRFEDEMKKTYKLRMEDKIEKMMNTMDMLSTILGTLK